ncbi:adenylate/guanylate cyclase domain-containing protein [Bradyrhizobium liaoningense]|uniref:adenylate/guanylate cyclase domain-containing protein n=1 Tax=Bradyrhizobium liaoningense TaxID=43992 RepID=UPI001BA84706|nr:adenylate/guanylate cyclase domain-containing protein [Bradyrhizobium liaoningense]MBR0822826.1 adenylate/guanylate cyclase domain-containing protein [Bradyrhizobium liaoningense]
MFYSPRPHSLGPAIVLAACIFLVDTLSSLQFAVASLYVVVVLIGAYDLQRRGIILTGICCATLTALSYVLAHGCTVEGAAPLRSLVSFVSITITVVLVIRNRSANERLADVKRERTNLARFFSPKIVEQLVQIDVPLSVARRQKAAVLFADVVGFTTHASGKPPDEIIGLLRDLLGLLSEAVFLCEGSIDKFLGDGLMAVFGPPIPGRQDATNAALCALQIRERLGRWNEQHANDPDKAIRIAVGIHCGEVIQGDVGTDKRLEFTVVGDTVNIASRVESYCRVLDATVLVTGEFMKSLLAEGSFDVAEAFTSEGKHLLRGRKEPIQLYSLKAG